MSTTSPYEKKRKFLERLLCIFNPVVIRLCCNISPKILPYPPILIVKKKNDKLVIFRQVTYSLNFSKT